MLSSAIINGLFSLAQGTSISIYQFNFQFQFQENFVENKS